MQRFSIGMMLAASALVTACAGPIETRIDSALTAAPAKGASYILSAPEGPLGSVENEAARLLETRLAEHGLSRTTDAETATHAVALSVSDRPADMTYRTGDNALTTVKPKKPFQNCQDRDFRVAVVITRIADASDTYRGSAAEYHCKAKMLAVMPSLLDAALSGLSGDVSGARIVKRKGLE